MRTVILSGLLALALLAQTVALAVAETAENLQQQLQQYQEQQISKQDTQLFDSEQGWGVQYRYYFVNSKAEVSSDWLNSGNTKIAVYNSQKKNIGSIDLANIVNGGKIDLLAYAGLNNNIRSTGELALTYGNGFELSYQRLYGSATANNQILTHPNNGVINSYIASTLSSSFSADIVAIQKSWDVANLDILGLRLLIGAKEFLFNYSYSLATAAPSEVIQPNYSGNIANGLTWPVPYAGAGVTINLGDAYLVAEGSGFPMLGSYVPVSMAQIRLDANYKLADWATAQAGYSYLGLAAQIQRATVQKYLGQSFVLPDAFTPLNAKVEFSGPYVGLDIHF